jgi:hypothetical protein
MSESLKTAATAIAYVTFTALWTLVLYIWVTPEDVQQMRKEIQYESEGREWVELRP